LSLRPAFVLPVSISGYTRLTSLGGDPIDGAYLRLLIHNDQRRDASLRVARGTATIAALDRSQVA
jgi:hypothetical protein